MINNSGNHSNYGVNNSNNLSMSISSINPNNSSVGHVTGNIPNNSVNSDFMSFLNSTNVTNKQHYIVYFDRVVNK